MEEEIQQQKSNDTPDYLNAKVGEKEGSKALEPKPIVVASVTIQTENKDGETMENPLANIHCKHPDKEDLIKLTSIKWLNGEKMAVSALFITADDEGLFMKDSGIARLLKFVKTDTLSDLVGKTIDTVKQLETSRYLCLKCY